MNQGMNQSLGCVLQGLPHGSQRKREGVQRIGTLSENAACSVARPLVDMPIVYCWKHLSTLSHNLLR